METSAARAARLELDAAAIAMTRLGDRVRACELLERAAARAPTNPAVDRRVLEDLVRLHEADGRLEEAAKARRGRLRFVTDPAVIAYELRALAAAAEQAGDPLDVAIGDVQRRAGARRDRTRRSSRCSTRLLGTAGKHDQRIATWLQEAARTDEPTARGRRRLPSRRAARICDTIGRAPGVDATRHLRSAWVSSPGDAEVLDALARHLSPPRTEAADTNARSLVELYAQAADQATDEARKVAFLEKVALLWEDVLGDPGRAAHTYEQILEIDPNRRGAMLGLERTAARVDDPRMLARALLEEARLSLDDWTKIALRTRAAEALEHQDAARAIAPRARGAVGGPVESHGARARDAARGAGGAVGEGGDVAAGPRGRGADHSGEGHAVARARADARCAASQAPRGARVPGARARSRPGAPGPACRDRASARGPRRPAGSCATRWSGSPRPRSLPRSEQLTWCEPPRSTSSA